MTLLWIKQVVKLLVLPPAGPLLVALVGLMVVRRRPRVGSALLAIGLISLTLLSMSAVGGLMVRSLDRSSVWKPGTISGAGAIVVLGGGLRPFAPEYGGATVNSATLERLRYGARLARETGLPILVSGGIVSAGAPPEAVLMRDVLTSEFSLPVRWVETRSRNTHENALRSAELLSQSGIRRVLLVGHAYDFPRSTAEFRAAGIDAIAAPIDMQVAGGYSFGDFLPSVTGMRLSHYAIYEFLANVAFHLSK
jgi:uncharacterized SAM-binding protein YcdF (DUF218 family)